MKTNNILGNYRFPPKNTKFTFRDFFQIEVDYFIDGSFLFLGADIIKIKTDKKLEDLCTSVDRYGWVISTYCYTYNCYYKILICNWTPKPWKNSYDIRGTLSFVNKCDGFCEYGDISDFLDLIDYED